MKFSPLNQDTIFRQAQPYEFCLSTINDECVHSIDDIHTLEHLFSSTSSTNSRVIKRAPIIFTQFAHFNEQILGPELSKSLYWFSLLSIKSKYLFSTELQLDLLHEFKQVERKFYQQKYQPLSVADKILMSCMRVFASWDKNVSILVVEECSTFLGNKMRAIFLQCLSELSVRTSIYITDRKPVDGVKPVEIINNIVN